VFGVELMLVKIVALLRFCHFEASEIIVSKNGNYIIYIYIYIKKISYEFSM
jgi:hypothetical protein